MQSFTEEDILRACLDGLGFKEIKRIFGVSYSQTKEILVKNNQQILSPAQRLLKKRQKNLDESAVTCQICDAKMYDLQPHLVIHNITAQQYKERFNAVAIRSRHVHERRSKSAKEKYEKQPELKEKLREVGRKNIKKVNESGKGWKTPKGFWSNEHKEYMRQKMLGREITWVDKIKETHWTKRDDASEIIDKILQNTHFKKGKYISTKTQINETYHSSLELKRMMQFDHDKNVKFWTKKHNIKIPYLLGGSEHHYFPDFIIEMNDGTMILEETKGYIKDRTKHDAKCSAALNWCNARNIIFRVIMQNEIQDEKEITNQNT